MPTLGRTLAFALPLLVLVTVSPARAQSASRTTGGSGSKITVAGSTYNVTPMGGFLRIDDLDGHMIGMARKDGSVIAPQSGPRFDIVKAVAYAYMHPGNEASAPAASSAPPAAGGAPASSPPGAPAAPSETILFPATGGAVVRGTPFGDITYSADGTEARTVQKTVSPVVGETTIELIARYTGGDDPGKGKTADAVKGGARTLFESMNPRAKGNINTRGNDEIVVSQSTNGGKETPLLGTGEKHVAESPYAVRDLNAGSKQRADGFLKAAYEGLQAAMAEAQKRRAAGVAASFDPAGTTAGQNALKEYARYEASLVK
jgi:hypothetical protein